MKSFLKNKKIDILLGVVCIALTFAICVQLKTNNAANNVVSKEYTEDKLRDEVLKWKEKYDYTYSQLEKAEKTLDAQREKASQFSGNSATIETELKVNNQLLGLTKLKGKGVIITLTDNKTVGLDTLNISDYLIHAEDLVQLVNELKNAKAEAVSINGQRIVNRTGITCDGNVVRINNQKVGAPFIVKAIGYPEWIESALSIPSGFIQTLSSYGITVKLEKSNNIEIPKYDGVYNLDYIVTER